MHKRNVATLLHFLVIKMQKKLKANCKLMKKIYFVKKGDIFVEAMTVLPRRKIKKYHADVFEEEVC